MRTRRPDGPTWFVEFSDAWAEANFRADLTRLRYRIRWEPNNQWWHIYETTTALTPKDPS